ncbi:16S rRNA (adenine1518-N6/adenine1519-N6)-dimethyltransferase [Campylobacter blaseri]|uniref:Ribosomal RNA small subunit methyltransferase A n=1 Tax=Campylobacter blaseri TaxID=2042961 RepID=A0A2P8R3E0_9BACT|nr:16S rRNA (adenine(1518)-N(6)/adenine(1519)-N(6))-dimethyltransferase RsmA [Campylobacter blaseri]PSM53013.1 16S rRNA (adenine(1518)-N(6)/adenine(1519)-N(6))-dimethyltransferase [Campylobacter blaseri]PSM54480.1 16S rRNA (adenine(1518)-N(6)/adenine(1519)-N(6))-dimethyltransferase [Campylobacter blaseri]QKF85275.1 16S rRNA (adenine1518-N6/adenine1519-N6)-dimethyltransferase [Campylobacter blaseri]
MIKAKKQFGQNFLKDKHILEKIIQAIPNDVDSVVEIGAGLGDLTKELLKISKVKSYEIDVELYSILKDKFYTEIQDNRLELELGDVLEVWQRKNLSDKKYFLVANLPYYIATRIILNAIDDYMCSGLIVMIQKEVAEKFSAVSSKKEFSPLTILANLQGSCELLFDVPPECFEPSPKVNSSVIRLIKTKRLEILFKTELEYSEFQSFLKTAFMQPRKTLLKNLSSKFDKSSIMEFLSENSLETNIRAHQLNTALFINIFKFLKAKNDGRENSKETRVC